MSGAGTQKRCERFGPKQPAASIKDIVDRYAKSLPPTSPISHGWQIEVIREAGCVHLVDMGQSRKTKTCVECGRKFPGTGGRGRPRLYCGSSCRKRAHERQRTPKPSPTPSSTQTRDQPRRPMTTAGLLKRIEESISVQDAQEVIDWIVDSPDAMHVLLDELIVRIAIDQLLEDVRYQRTVDSLVTAYSMVGRITGGSFALPAVELSS